MVPFTIIQSDITKLCVDAVVNAANTDLRMGGGVCKAIFEAAGADRLTDACRDLAPIKTGEAVITPGFMLPARYIIHTAGPVYRDGRHGEEALLRSCYMNSLAIAVRHRCESIAFPLISGGIYGYPKVEALRVATEVIRDFVGENDIVVSLVVFDRESFVVGEELLQEVRRYIDGHYLEACLFSRQGLEDSVKKGPARKGKWIRRFFEAPEIMEEPIDRGLDETIGRLDETFSVTLLHLIDATGKKDAEIYRRANIDRRLFSKIRSNVDYAPSKPTVLAFAIALELDLDKTNDLLERAGFALSHSRKFDVIVEYFIQNRKYDIFAINEVLFSYDQPLLGG